MKNIPRQEIDNLSKLLLSPQYSNVLLGFEMLENYADAFSEWSKELVLIWQLHDDDTIKAQAKDTLEKYNSKPQLNKWEKNFALFEEIPQIAKYSKKVKELLEVHEKVRKEYQALIELNHQFCLHYYTIAEKLHSDYEKHFDLAKNYYKIALKTNPDHKDSLFDFARLLSRSPEGYDSAIKLYSRAAEFAPKSALIMNNIGVIYANKKEFETAYEYFHKALALDPNHALTMSNLSLLCAFDIDGPQYRVEAKSYFKRLAEMNFTKSTHWNNWGAYLWLIDKNYDKAKEVYEKGLKLNPDNADLLGNLGELHIDIFGEYKKGLELYRKAVEIEVSSYRLITTIVALMHYSNKKEEAIQYYQKLVAISANKEISRDDNLSEKQWQDFLTVEKVLLSIINDKD